MTETSRAAPLDDVELDRLLVETKLAIPVARPGFVSRSDLIERARTSGRRVVTVTAPAGYGKSTLLAQWAAAETRPVAWVSLDRFDDDPVSLLALLASAYVRAVDGDPGVVADMRGHSTAALGRAAPRLASALRTSARSFVIMLDDLHELDSPGVADVLSVIIAGIPDGSQFVTASRTEQPHLPRIRAAGDAFELEAADLALDTDGAHQIFAEAHVPITAALAEVVVGRTEGWPVGLHLAAVIAHESDDAAATITGDDRYVTDYLYRESLAGLPPELQQFLRCTSILETFSAPLCDALLGTNDARQRLRELEASNVFLIRLDRRREWYRYHPLFREFLLGELGRTDPDGLSDLRRRAADWYERIDAPALAVEQVLGTSDTERLVRLVTELVLPTFHAGEMATAQRWLTALGGATIAHSPPLVVLAGWLAAMSGQENEAERWIMSLEGVTYDAEPADGTASFASGRAMLRSAMCPAGPAQAMADIELALAEEPRWSAWRDQALSVAGGTCLLVGDTARADAYFREASSLAATTGNYVVVVLSDSERAMIAMDQDRWAEAGRLIDTALGLIAEHRLDDYAPSVMTFAAAARSAAHRGDTATAAREMTRAMRARPVTTSATPGLAIRVRLHLARSSILLHDHATARHLVRECEDILIRRPALGVLVDEIVAVTSLIDSTAHGDASAPPLTPAELRLLPYLQTHLTVPEISARLFVSRNTVRTEVGSIYRKLGVASRAAAVERATAVGLLGA